MKFHDGTEYIAVSDGFVEVRKDKVSIIVQTAETAREIDVERAKLAKAKQSLTWKMMTTILIFIEPKEL